jgi:hypothetical protein
LLTRLVDSSSQFLSLFFQTRPGGGGVFGVVGLSLRGVSSKKAITQHDKADQEEAVKAEGHDLET